jgi:hypothetical protein
LKIFHFWCVSKKFQFESFNLSKIVFGDMRFKTEKEDYIFDVLSVLHYFINKTRSQFTSIGSIYGTFGRSMIWDDLFCISLLWPWWSIRIPLVEYILNFPCIAFRISVIDTSSFLKAVIQPGSIPVQWTVFNSSTNR